MSRSACRLVPLFSPIAATSTAPSCPVCAHHIASLQPRARSPCLSGSLSSPPPSRYESACRPPYDSRAFVLRRLVRLRSSRLNTSNVPTVYGTFWIISQPHLKARVSYVPLSHKPLHVGPGKGPQRAGARARTNGKPPQDVRVREGARDSRRHQLLRTRPAQLPPLANTCQPDSPTVTTHYQSRRRLSLMSAPCTLGTPWPRYVVRFGVTHRQLVTLGESRPGRSFVSFTTHRHIH